ncbi:MAG: hypothetical protein ACO236_00220 [Candidatus Nanopelagicaceae bacterium]
MGRTFEPGFWSRVLGEKGLESPGREQAVKETLAYIAAKKQTKEEERKEKQTQKRGRKKK